MPDWARHVRPRLSSLDLSPTREREIIEELAQHLDDRWRELVAGGMSEADAERSALAEFREPNLLARHLAPLRQAHAPATVPPDASTGRLLGDFWQDLRHAVRSWRRQPAFTLATVLTLALGIGANTAIYTLVDAVVWRPLPVDRPDELFRVGDTNACCVNNGLYGDTSLFSYAFYRELRDHATSWSTLAAFQVSPETLSMRRSGAPGGPLAMTAEFVSGTYFPALRAPMAAGRWLVPDDDRPGAPPAVVLSFRAWRAVGGGAPAAGATILVGASPATVVGVTAPEFFGETLRANATDVWLPLADEPVIRQNRQGIVTAEGRSTSLLDRPDQQWLYVFGRLRAGVGPGTAQEEASLALRRWLAGQNFLSAADSAALPAQHVVVNTFETGVSSLRARYGDWLRILGIISAAVLVLTCASLAGLMLARTQASQAAIRVALGASRGRLVRGALTAGLALAAAGGLAGVALGMAGTRVILGMTFPGARGLPIGDTPSPAILALAAGLAVVSGLAFSGLPAWFTSRTRPIAMLRSGTRTTGEHVIRSRQVLVVLQIALSLALATVAGLLTRSLSRLEAPIGFQTADRVIVRIDPGAAGYSVARLPALYERLEASVSRLPGLASASLSQYSPMSGFNWEGPISLDDRPVDPAHHLFSSYLRVGPHYFETIGTRVLAGRAIEARDTAASVHVAVVNQAFAGQFFPGGGAIGHRLGIGEEAGHDADFQIVGLVEDVKYYDATAPANPTVFIPLLQTVAYGAEGLVSMQARSLFVGNIELHLAHGAAAALDLDATIRRVLAGVDPNLTPLAIVPFRDQVDRNFVQQVLVARFTSFYGVLALLLAALGLYGVTNQYVAARTNEIGVRMALGADRRRVLLMILRRAVWQTAAGVAIGVPIVLGAGRLLAGRVYGVGSYDVRSLLAALIVVTLSTHVAALIPAWRGATIDPVRALRCE